MDMRLQIRTAIVIGNHRSDECEALSRLCMTKGLVNSGVYRRELAGVHYKAKGRECQ